MDCHKADGTLYILLRSVSGTGERWAGKKRIYGWQTYPMVHSWYATARMTDIFSALASAHSDERTTAVLSTTKVIVASVISIH